MEKLIELRKESNLSQAELAEKLNISQQAVCKYERGLSEPDIYTLKAMAKTFHTSIDYLVEYEPDCSETSPGVLCVDNKPLTRMEIGHLIKYRMLTTSQKEHIDLLINDLI